MKTLYIIATFSAAFIFYFILWQEYRKEKRYKKQKEWLKKKHMQD